MASKPITKRVKTDGVEETSTEMGPKSIAQHLMATPELSTLLMLVKKVDKDGKIVKLLSNPGTFTVFAPNNKAFEDLLKALDNKLPDDETLRHIILYHVLPMKQSSTDLMDELKKTKAKNSTFFKVYQTAWQQNPVVIKFNSMKKQIKVCNSVVVAADVIASNGVVHVIDKVLLPSECVAEKF